jgi:hypothetical protein
MSGPATILLRNDPHVDWEGDTVEFRLTYRGILLAETERSGAVRRARADHKHQIRKDFHKQLKKWWAVSPYLSGPASTTSPFPRGRIFGRPSPQHTIEGLSKRFERIGYNFVPLVTRDLEVFCSVEILFLRSGETGWVLTREGDLDNRLKTFFDALSMPRERPQLGQFTEPASDEKPFFCLLEDDSVLTRAAVESDVLLEPVSNPPDPNDSHIVITVRIRPYRVSAENVGFA